MQRREVLTFLAAAAASGRMAWPTALRAQDQASSRQGAGDQIGQVATLQGSATVARGGPAVALRVNDFILENDALETGVSSTLGVTFDDETTFSLSANTHITINEFVYQQGGSGNAALFTVARGTAAFLASKVASTGDMKIATPIATMGIRGTTGVVDVPEAGTTGEPRIKLYADADGHVGRIEVFDRQGARLGILSQGSSAFALRRNRRPFHGGAVPNPAAGSAARPRRAAAAFCLARGRAAADDRASAIARAQPATAQRTPAARRSAAATKHSRPARRAIGARAARPRPAAPVAQAQLVRAEAQVAAGRQNFVAAQ